MRMGEIFARGSCRALKWMALFGVLFALGAGSAFAQQNVGVESIELRGASAAGNLDEDTETSLVVTLTDKIVNHVNKNNTNEVQITVAVSFDGADFTSSATGEGAKGNAEFEDLRIDNDNVDSSTLSFTFLIKQGNSSGSVPFYSREDEDAVDEGFSLMATVSATENTDDDTDRDDDTDGDQFTTTIATGGGEAEDADFTIKDIDPQEYELDVKTKASSIKEDGSFKVSIKADPPRPDNEEVEFELVASDRQYTFGTGDDSTGTLYVASSGDNEANNGYESEELEVNAPSSDGNRESDKITISAYSAASRRGPAEAEVVVTVLDVHALPASGKITASAMDEKEDGTKVTSVKEGEKVYLTVTVDRGDSGYPSGEELKVELMAADPSQSLDYRLSATSVTIPSGTKKKSQTEDPVMLEIIPDEDVGAETLVLNLVATGKTTKNGSGESIGMFAIDIEDATTPMVWAKEGAMEAIYGARIEAQGSDGMINPGDDFDIMTDDLFGHLPDVTVDYAASSDHQSVSVSASGEKIMVMPQAMEGTAKITVTATASMGDSFKTQQTTSNIAQIMFEVEVKLATLTYTIMDPEDMHLTEGSSAMVKVMASRALDGDETAKIMLMRDGSSTAGMDDYTVMPEMVMLKAGDMEAEFTVTALEDNMPDAGTGTNMAEMLTLFVVVDDMQMTDESVMFYIWDMAVPALPIVAQLLLAGLLGIGGYRRYRRR